MRVTTANTYAAALTTLQQRQQEMSEAQQRLTSGKRVLSASDDPTAAARAERALATQARSDASQRALESSRNAMTLSESALGDAGDLLQQIRESLVEAGNASYTDAERAGLADKIAGLRTELLAVANRSDGSGGYLFSGQGSGQTPFVDASGGVQYRGVTGQVTTATAEALPLTVDGAGAWTSAASGNGVFVTAPGAGNTGSAWIDSGSVTSPTDLTDAGYSVQFSVADGATTYTIYKDGEATDQAGVPYESGKSIAVDGMSFSISGAPADGDTFTTSPSTQSLNVFDTIDRVVAELKTPMRGNAQVQQGVNSGLRDIDQSMSALGSLRSHVGEVLNQTDAAESRIADLKLYAQTEQTNATDLDMVQAVSDFSNQQTGYDAALKSYSMVQKLSLFNYIS